VFLSAPKYCAPSPSKNHSPPATVGMNIAHHRSHRSGAHGGKPHLLTALKIEIPSIQEAKKKFTVLKCKKRWSSGPGIPMMLSFFQGGISSQFKQLSTLDKNQQLVPSSTFVSSRRGKKKEQIPSLLPPSTCKKAPMVLTTLTESMMILWTLSGSLG